MGGRKTQTIARNLRRAATLAERRAWELLRNRRMLGFKFRRQHVIDGFVVDFYCSERRLVVEIDGIVHDHVRALEYDRARTEYLEARGLRVIRVRNEEVTEATLTTRLRELVLRSPSPHGGEGARG